MPSFLTVHIPIRIEGPDGFLLTSNLEEGSDNILELPAQGILKMKVGYLAFQTDEPNLKNWCLTHQTKDVQTFLYTETEQSFTVDEKTSILNISFQKPFEIISSRSFGFQMQENQNKGASHAKIFYLDPISSQALVDPCTQKEFFEIADTEGRLAFNFPVYNSDKNMQFKIVTENGFTRILSYQFEKSNTKTQFFKIDLFQQNPDLEPMDENTESFLNDGNSIAYRRDVLKRNPRFPDFLNFTFQAPDPVTGTLNFLSDLYRNENMGGNDDPFSLLKQRRLKVRCQISEALPTGHGTIVAPYQDCPTHLGNAFKELTTHLVSQNFYFIDAYLIDDENFVAADKTLSNPAFPVLSQSPLAHSFQMPEIFIYNCPFNENSEGYYLIWFYHFYKNNVLNILNIQYDGLDTTWGSTDEEYYKNFWNYYISSPYYENYNQWDQKFYKYYYSYLYHNYNSYYEFFKKEYYYKAFYLNHYPNCPLEPELRYNYY
jgi:hypothetical protein